MGTFSALLAICAGNSPAPGEFPAQRPVMRSFDVFFELRLNKRLSKQSWGWWFETPSQWWLFLIHATFHSEFDDISVPVLSRMSSVFRSPEKRFALYLPLLSILYFLMTHFNWWFHYSDVIMDTVSSQITSLTIVYLTVNSAQIKENIKAPRHWPLCGEFTGDQLIPCTNGQWHGKCLHLMTSSCQHVSKRASHGWPNIVHPKKYTHESSFSAYCFALVRVNFDFIYPWITFGWLRTRLQ